MANVNGSKGPKPAHNPSRRAAAGLGLAAALGMMAGAATARAHSPAEEMAEAANNFLAGLTPEQRQQATFELAAAERRNWHFVPRERKGLPWQQMDPAQRHLAAGLLSSGLSQRGYLKATTIMSLEAVLRDLEQGRGPRREPELYYVSIFGAPTAEGAWGWRVEGHHLSVNFTLAAGHITATPSFLGSNPAEVREGPRKGLRVLAAEEDLGRELARSLTEEQRPAGWPTNAAPADVVTGPDRPAGLLSPEGLPTSQMTDAQRELLRRLLREYVFRNRAEVAEKDLAQIEAAGFEKVRFVWLGGLAPGQGHYYRVQGPTFIMEFDNTQNQANHIHALWRDFANDFGEDLLRRHYQQSHQAK